MGHEFNLSIRKVDLRNFDFFVIDSVVLDEFKLTPCEFMTYSILVRHVNKDRGYFPDNREIAEIGNMSIKEVEASLERLKELQMIGISTLTATGQVYVILLHPWRDDPQCDWKSESN